MPFGRARTRGFANEILNALFAGDTVINKNGIFLFNSLPPAPGNLVMAFAINGGSIGGNTYPAGFNWGIWDNTGTLKQHFGIDNHGVLYCVGPDGVIRIQINNGSFGIGPDIRFFNDFGAVLEVVDPSRGGNFQYQDNNTATQGTLIGSQVGKNTTDPVNGTTQNAGINVIDPVFGDFLSIVGANILWGVASTFTKLAADGVGTGSTNQGPFRSLAGPEQTQTGHPVIRLYGKSPDGTRGAGIVISLTDPPTRATDGITELQGDLALLGTATPAAPPSGYGKVSGDINGYPVAQTGVAGDTNLYRMGEAEYIINSDLLINLASNIPVFSVPVGVGKYYAEAWLVIQNTTAADPADWAFTGPTALAPQLVSYKVTTSAATAIVNHFASSGYTASFTNQGQGGNQELLIKLTANFTAQGTLVLNAKEHISGNTVNISAGSKLKIKRIA